jgi:hypothetical protein
VAFIAAYVFVCASIVFNTPYIALTGATVLIGFTHHLFLALRQFVKKTHTE